MKRHAWPVACLFLFTFTCEARAADRGRALNTPPPASVRALVRRAVLLAESDRLRAALLAARQAVKAAPDYLPAHVQYRDIMTTFLGRRDEVEQEYQSLIRRHPDNPVYLMAVYSRWSPSLARAHFERVIELAPEWAWAHYAKALLFEEKEPERAAEELRLCIERDPTVREAYERLLDLQEHKLKKIGDALQTAARLAARTEFRPSRFEPLWRLRLAQASESAEAQQVLRAELTRLANSARDLDLLLTIRSAYLNLLKDPAAAHGIEEQIKRVDPTWYPQRGWLYMLTRENQSGVPRYIVLVNRQIILHGKATEIESAEELMPAEKLHRLADLLRQRPNEAMRRILYEKIFRQAVKARATAAVRKYGEALRALDPEDYGLLAQMALTLAETKTQTAAALRYARAAERGTAEFRPIRTPPNTSPLYFQTIFPKQKQREAYEKQRVLALHAAGWALVQAGQAGEAEPKLRQAVAAEPTEARLSHLAVALRRLGRDREAAEFEAKAATFLADTLRRRFVDEKPVEFEFTSLDGRSYKLADLKGKVVVINFWATWCGPCVQEMPTLARLYDKFKADGLEVLAVATDKEAEKVAPFVAKRKLNFPIFKRADLGKLYAVEVIPTSIFIDRQGHIRFRKTGFDDESARELEVVIRELLK